MHPNKAEGIRGHNAKLRRLTRHYGAASPSYHVARENYPKADGAEESVGYGADSAAATARADRPAPRVAAGNAVATYRHGGKVRHRAAGGALKSPRKGGKGKTNISITILPGSPPSPILGANPALPPPMPPRPPVPAAGAGPMPPPGGGVSGATGPLGQMALQQRAAGLIPRRRGGRVHADAMADKKLIRHMVKPDALRQRAAGGPVRIGLTAGAQSGEGRLQRNRHMDRKLRPTTGVVG